jgi:hypothetical protein
MYCTIPKVSSEIFQRKLTEAVGDLNGTFTIADNITIARCGQTDKEIGASVSLFLTF